METAENLQQALLSRGVRTELAMWMPACLHADVIQRTLAWYDAERVQRDIGPGVLVDELRKGGRPLSSDDLLSRQAAYGAEIVDWLRRHFPQWNREEGNRTHPAAIASVIRLHHRLATRHLSASEHGPEIRASVTAFEETFAEPVA